MKSDRGSVVDSGLGRLSLVLIPDRDWKEMSTRPEEHPKQKWSKKRASPPKAEACLDLSEEKHDEAGV